MAFTPHTSHHFYIHFIITRHTWTCLPSATTHLDLPALCHHTPGPACPLPLQVHTPDSSRYWIADTYKVRHSLEMEPENIDKEFLRLWFRSRCDPYKDKVGGRP